MVSKIVVIVVRVEVRRIFPHQSILVIMVLLLIGVMLFLHFFYVVFDFTNCAVGSLQPIDLVKWLPIDLVKWLVLVFAIVDNLARVGAVVAAIIRPLNKEELDDAEDERETNDNGNNFCRLAVLRGA